jgi:hypothetical protein
MSIRKLALFSEFFEKQAALFEVPANALASSQKRFLQIFCSMAFTKCLFKERRFQLMAEDDEPFLPEDLQERKTLRHIMDICRTYGATNEKMLLEHGTEFVATISLNMNDTDKGSKYFGPQDMNLDVLDIPVYIIIDPAKKLEMSENWGVNNGWEGMYLKHGRRTEVYIFINMKALDSSLKDVETFTYYLNFVRNSFRHEMQHATQNAVKEFKGMKEMSGLPSKKIRNKFDEKSSVSTTGLPHSLVDAEFYTDLTDSVQDFKMRMSSANTRFAQSDEYINGKVRQYTKSAASFDLLNLMHKCAPQIRSILMKCWIAEISPQAARKMIQGVISSNVVRPLMTSDAKAKLFNDLLTSNYSNRYESIFALAVDSPFFSDLVYQAPGKYKKAVIEFYKATRFLLSN